MADPMKWTMRGYIDQTADAAHANLGRIEGLVAPLAEAFAQAAPRSITIVASGSSANAAHCALPFMRSCLPGCEIRIQAPFSFVHYGDVAPAGELVLVVTQSGRSTNAIEALDALRERGFEAVCLTGDVGADAASHADRVIDYGAGEELVGYVTKGVSLLALFLMAFSSLAGGRADRIVELAASVDLSDAVRRGSYEFFREHERALTSMGVSYWLGAGPTWGVASEGALKAGETLHIPSSAHETEEFIHGPNLQLTPAYSMFFFDAGDSASERTRRIWSAAGEVSDRSYLLTPEDGLRSSPGVMTVAELPSPEVASFVYLPFVQVISAMASDALSSTRQHPLLRRFKRVASAKTEGYVDYDGDGGGAA